MNDSDDWYGDDDAGETNETHKSPVSTQSETFTMGPPVTKVKNKAGVYDVQTLPVN